MKKGDILLFKDSGLLSKIIGGLSGGKYSHVAMCVKSTWMEYDIIESTWKGIKVNRLKKEDYKFVDVFRCTIAHKSTLIDIVDDALLYVNYKYDYSLLFTIMLNRWFGVNPIDSKTKFICSEFIDMIYKKNGIDIIPYIYNDDVTPNEFGKILNNSKNFMRVGIHD